MRLNPQQAPFSGHCVVTVELDGDERQEEEEEEAETEFYLLFSGSTQTHLTNVLRVSHVVLQAICPAHNVCEQVSVTLCFARPGQPVDMHSRETFYFVQDMALDLVHLLHDSKAPQEALLEDKQISLKECERLDLSLTQALKDILPATPSQTHTNPHVDGWMGNQTLSSSVTDSHNSETCEGPCMDLSALLDRCIAVPQWQQLSSLLHLAASHNLRRVALLLLQQPGATEALKRPNTQGLTPAHVAGSRGYRQLVEVFTQYEMSSNVQEEPSETWQVCPEGRVFEHHADLDTYTLTFPRFSQGKEETGMEDKEGWCLQKEVTELRRLIHLHKDKKIKSDFAGPIALTHASTPLSIHLQPFFNGQLDSQQGAGLAAETTENCRITEKSGSPCLLEERMEGEEFVFATHTSCTSGSICQSQEEAGGEQKGTQAANFSASCHRKNKKKTSKNTRHATESPGNDRTTPEASRWTAPSGTDGTVSSREPVETIENRERGATKTQTSPGPKHTPLPRKPESAPCSDGKCAFPTTSIAEKQEGVKWEVDLLVCERVVQAETQQEDTDHLPAAERTAIMGQEQSQHSQESQSDPEEPSQLKTNTKSTQHGRGSSPKSQDVEREPPRGPWRDGGSLGSRMGLLPNRPEPVAKTIWYQGESLDQDSKDRNSQSVWYDSEIMDHREHEQLEHGNRQQRDYDVSSLQAVRSSPQLLEWGLSSHQPSAALSQPHAAGSQPAPSHVPDAQRKEVQGSQRQEEVGPEWKEEGGLEGDKDEVDDVQSTHSQKSCKAADIAEGGREGKEGKEKEIKGRKKKRKKRGKKGGTTAKLSSSSSIESQSQIEIQAETEPATDQSQTEAGAKDQSDFQSSSALGLTWLGEADGEAMRLLNQAECQTREAQGPDSDVTNADPHFTTPDFRLTDQRETDLKNEVTTPVEFKTKDSSMDISTNYSTVTASEVDITMGHTEVTTTVEPIGKEVPQATVRQTVDVVTKPLIENEGLIVDQTDLVECNYPKELPVNHLNPTEVIQDTFLVEFPEQTQHVQLANLDKPLQPVDPMGGPVQFMESVHPTDSGGLPLEGTADVFIFEEREGKAKTCTGGYSEHCSTSEMLRDLQLKEEKIYNEHIAATAVAVVTVAIASAMASLELSQQLEGIQSDTQSACKDQENVPQPAVRLEQPADILNNSPLSPQLSLQLKNKDGENCQLLARTPAEAENQPVANIEPIDHFREKAKDETSEETEDVPAAQVSSNQQTCFDLTGDAFPKPDKEEIHIESIQNKPFTLYSTPKKEDEPGQSSAVPEANENITTEVDGVGEVQAESQPLCPVIDTGQHPEISETLCPDSQEELQAEECTDPSVCQEESGFLAEGDEQQVDLSFPHNQTGNRGSNYSHPVETVTAESKVGQQVCKEDKAEDCESYEKGFLDVSNQLHQATEQDSRPEQELPTLPFSHSLTPVVYPCNLTPSVEEPTVHVDFEIAQCQSSDSLADTELITTAHLDSGNGVFTNLCQESVAVDNEDSASEGLDTVDGWRDKERIRKKSEEEARKKTVTEGDTSQTAATAEDDWEQTKREPDTSLTPQIQRETEVFYPVQPCPELSTVTTCTDIKPNTAESVSVYALHREVDDSIFKKPEDPPSGGHGDGRACVSPSPTDDALTQGGALSTSKEDIAMGAPNAEAAWSNTVSWKSETSIGEEGGEETWGMEEEEKKDHLPENAVSSALSRASNRSSSPLRRHSWEPTAAESVMTQHSLLKSLSGEARRANPPLHRRSISWCPSNLHHPDKEQIDNRSSSLEGLGVERGAPQPQCPSSFTDHREKSTGRSSHPESQLRGSLLSLTEEEQEGDGSNIHSQVLRMTSCPAIISHPTLTKSISMVTISHRNIDAVGSLCTTPASLDYSISEEEPGPLRSDPEGKGVPKISRTFSYLRSKMSKKGKEKEKEKRGEKERESKEKEKKSSNGHTFVLLSPCPSGACQHCTKTLHNKESYQCNSCGVHVHKCCRESVPVCAKSRVKKAQVAEPVPGLAVNTRSKSTSSASSLSSVSSSSSREHWSTATSPDDHLAVLFPRRPPSFFNTHSNLAKSISTSNIAGLDDVPLKGLKFLSQSTDSLHQGSKVDASTESLTDEGTEMIDSHLMGEFECDLEADSWSSTMDKKFLKALKKDEIKRQDIIYELYQTEFHHVRTLKIMSEVYYKGLQKELQLDSHTLHKIFPVLDNLLDAHTHFLTALLERKRASLADGQTIYSIGDVLVNQFSGCSAANMKKIYGKFCSRHNEAVNVYKDLNAKDKRFQAFIKRIMSCSIVRRLSISECILLVTQRITKYPVLIQRILQHTKDSDRDHGCMCEALSCVKEIITAVDSKVNDQEKKRRLREVYSRTDSKSIMRMKSGQMFAKEDLIRGRKLLHDGTLQLKTSAGRPKDVLAMLLSDVLVFLQEKDQKYVFASLDQRSTVLSLQNLIVREVANEERGLFLITAGIEKPEMVEVLACSKEERNTWRAIIQDAMHSMEKEEDEGVPSETEEDKRQQENRVKEIRDQLRKKDEQIISLLEEKIHIFRDLCKDSPVPNKANPLVRERMLFRATPEEITKGEPIIKDALREVESLHALVHNGVAGAGCSVLVDLKGGSVGPVCLPRRAETFGGFDSHQMNINKNGDRDEGDESLDLRRTESDSVLKKGVTANLQMSVKRSNEVQHSVTHLLSLLVSLQAVVVQQDSFIEDQRHALSDRLAASFSRHSSSSSLSSTSSSRPSSLIEQEKHRSLERTRQEAASLQKQQAAHLEEKRKREKEWDLKEKGLVEREERLRVEEEATRRRHQEQVEEKEMLQRMKEEHQRDVDKLEREKEALRRGTERLEAMKREQSEQLHRFQWTPSTTYEHQSTRSHSSSSLDLDSKEAAEEPKEVELSSSAPTKEPFLRIGSKRMGKNFNPFSSSSSSKFQGVEESQLQTRLLQLTKPKEKKDKKKKKGKGGEQTQIESKMMSGLQNDGDIFFC